MKEIRKIINLYDRLDHEKEPAALATVVSVEDSSYRRVGARMLVTSQGKYVGGISGGCLEGDALRRAQEAIARQKPSIVTYDTREGDNHQIGVGLGCEGKIEVLFVPLTTGARHHPIEVLRRVCDLRSPSVLLQVIGSETAGKLPGMSGRLYAASKHDEMGSNYGFAPGELVHTIELVEGSQKSKICTISDRAGNHYKVLFEFLRPSIRLVLVGDNYDITPFFAMSQELGWSLELVGLKRKFSKAAFASARAIYTYDELPKIVPDEHTAVLLMSHDYDKDMRAMRHFLPLRPAYLGLLGPGKRRQKMHVELAQEGLDLAGYTNLYSPIGLDLGATGPEEIAISALAEIIAVFRKRNGGFLRERIGSIYEK